MNTLLITALSIALIAAAATYWYRKRSCNLFLALFIWPAWAVVSVLLAIYCFVRYPQGHHVFGFLAAGIAWYIVMFSLMMIISTRDQMAAFTSNNVLSTPK